MATANKSLLVKTSVGDLIVDVKINGVESKNLSIELRKFDPRLPDGMQIERCRAVLISVKNTVSNFTISYSASLSGDCKGGACTGQGLEAIEWEDGGFLLVVGTDDAEALTRRLPNLSLTDECSIATYKEDTIEISLEIIPETKLTTFHLIFAENPSPELQPDSARFAADASHQTVLENF